MTKKMTRKELKKAIRDVDRARRRLEAKLKKLDESKAWAIWAGRVIKVASVGVADRHNVWPRYATKAAALRKYLDDELRDLRDREEDFRDARKSLLKARGDVRRARATLSKELRS